MKVGQLVIVRLETTENIMQLVTGLIVGKATRDKKTFYRVLTSGKTLEVTDMDLGPIDLMSEKERLEKKWNEL